MLYDIWSTFFSIKWDKSNVYNFTYIFCCILLFLKVKPDNQSHPTGFLNAWNNFVLKNYKSHYSSKQEQRQNLDGAVSHHNKTLSTLS